MYYSYFPIYRNDVTSDIFLAGNVLLWDTERINSKARFVLITFLYFICMN